MFPKADGSETARWRNAALRDPLPGVQSWQKIRVSARANQIRLARATKETDPIL